MEYRITKIDAAVDQLDWSIKLFLDHKAYVPAITLAGAAEEVLGARLGDSSSFRQLRDNLAKEYSLDRKIVSQEYLNKVRNWLKHDGKDCKDEECLHVDLETVAIQHIIRAIANLHTPNQLNSETNRFMEWLYENRKDLY